MSKFAEAWMTVFFLIIFGLAVLMLGFACFIPGIIWGGWAWLATGVLLLLYVTTFVAAAVRLEDWE